MLMNRTWTEQFWSIFDHPVDHPTPKKEKADKKIKLLGNILQVTFPTEDLCSGILKFKNYLSVKLGQ